LKDFTHAPAFDIQYEWHEDEDAANEKSEEGGILKDENGCKKFNGKNADHDSLVQEIYENVEQAMNEALEYSSNYCK